MRVERNINDEVIVKLTPEGERMYTMNAVYRDKLNDKSVYSFQIWELMQVFGEAMRFGSPIQVFVNNKLVFPRVLPGEAYAYDTNFEMQNKEDALHALH